MIITHKEFPNYRKYEMMYEGRPLSMEVGKLAELCNAAVLVKYGETTVLVTCTASARPKDGIDYFPLAVDFIRGGEKQQNHPGDCSQKGHRKSNKHP